jgi:hypothetical protein
MLKVSRSPSRAPLEPVFELGVEAAKALMARNIESLDEPSFTEAQKLMSGFVLNREEVVFAVPDPDSFLKLAREKGTANDVAFFEVFKKMYPENGAWPVFTTQQSDYGGCTIFDGKTLTGIYDAWSSFAAAHPGRYTKAVERERKATEEAFKSMCVCGSEAEYRKEREAFGKKRAVPAPDAPVRFSCPGPL